MLMETNKNPDSSISEKENQECCTLGHHLILSQVHCLCATKTPSLNPYSAPRALLKRRVIYFLLQKWNIMACIGDRLELGGSGRIWGKAPLISHSLRSFTTCIRWPHRWAINKHQKNRTRFPPFGKRKTEGICIKATKTAQF